MRFPKQRPSSTAHLKFYNAMSIINGLPPALVEGILDRGKCLRYRPLFINEAVIATVSNHLAIQSVGRGRDFPEGAVAITGPPKHRHASQ